MYSYDRSRNFETKIKNEAKSIRLQISLLTAFLSEDITEEYKAVINDQISDLNARYAELEEIAKEGGFSL